ncbi:MAG: AtpZ/AtpI family protein [Clostridia bacterium]|nr:AtpZ/AtpI family protein [Clostridia bacterium]
MPDKSRNSTMRALTWVTQFGLSLVSPLILCIYAAYWLNMKYGWGNFVVIIGLFVGLAASGMNMVKYYKAVKNESGGKVDDKKDADGRREGGGM